MQCIRGKWGVAPTEQLCIHFRRQATRAHAGQHCEHICAFIVPTIAPKHPPLRGLGTGSSAKFTREDYRANSASSLRGNQTCQRCNSRSGVRSIMNQFEPFSSLVNRGSTKTLQFWAAGATLFVRYLIRNTQKFTEIQTQSTSHVSVAFSTTILLFQTIG